MTIFTLFKSTVDYLNIDPTIFNKGTSEFDYISGIGIFLLTVMFFENSIYIAYKKDILFSIMTLIDLVGIYTFNKEWKDCCD